MPMAVNNGNAHFQGMMEDLLGDVDCADPFVDDIIVSSRTLETTDQKLSKAHFVDLCRVLDVLRKHKLTCNGVKAVLLAAGLEFAGQVVGHGMCRPIPGKLPSLVY